MARVWPLFLSLLVGFLTIFILIVLRKVRKHFIVKGLKWNGFDSLRFATSFIDLIKAYFPNNPSNPDTFRSFKGKLVVEFVGFTLKLTNFKLVFSLDSLNIYVNSSLFNPSKPDNVIKTDSSPSKLQQVLAYLITSTFKTFEFNCNSISLTTTFAKIEDSQIFVCEHLKIKNCSVFKVSTSVLELDSIKLEQFTIGPASCSTDLIFETNHLLLTRNFGTDQFDLKLKGQFVLNLNVTLLYFISSFIKSISSTVESESIDPFNASSMRLPWSILLNVSVPVIDFKLILPETDLTAKYFNWLQFKFSSVDLKCFAPIKGLPALTGWFKKFEMLAKIDDETNIGRKHFCPVDEFLRRGPKQIAGQSRKLIVLENVILSNWTSASKHQRTSLPKHLITEWISSILRGDPICSIKKDDFDLGVNDLEMPELEEFMHFESSNAIFTLEFFKNRNISTSKTLFGLLDQFDFNIPFEFPISSLIDHSVVLFKAGWRPLSKKTDKGYWIGDGDKFLRTDWAFYLKVNRARMRIEDDSFETKISAISHFQRKLAESRSRLESVIMSQQFSHQSFEESPETLKLANVLCTTNSKPLVTDQAHAILELNKTLFSEYRGLIGKSHLLTNWSLVDIAIDDLKLSLSWSPEYLGPDGSLSSLLNNIENGNQIHPETVDTLSTFLGGFVDISGSAVQINLRNYSKPIIIAPDLRIIGPVFLIEDGVKDPDVLMKFPVRVLPDISAASCFPNLPEDGIIDVLRSILPLKMYHCVHAAISQPELVQASVSPYWLGCIALLDRVFDRFVKSSTEDPSPPLPGWDKLRYNIHGCHSRLKISSPCIISRITDADPLSCTEVLNLSFPRGVDIGIIPGGVFVLKCPESSLSVDSQHLYRVRAALESSEPLHLWDLKINNEISGPQTHQNNFSSSSFDLSQNNLIPIIYLSETHLQLKFKIKNVFNDDPCHHWTVRPVSRSNSSQDCDWEHHDTFKSFRSKSIALELSGFVGSGSENIVSQNEIRFLYYRELERWISRYMGAHYSDIDVVKRGPLHQSAAIPEMQQRTSFSSVFTELHLSVDFSDLFICRLLNFSGLHESQALWSASRRSLLSMDWRRGIIDQHGREDWVYYYGEIEFLNVHFCVTSNSPIPKYSDGSIQTDFPVNIPEVQFNDLLRAPRLFYLSLNENCFQYDPESLEVQCQTVLIKRRKLLSSLAEATRELSVTSTNDADKCNQLSIAIDALQKRKKYYDSFLFKTQSNSYACSNIVFDDPASLEFADTTHFEIYNAQLVWSLFNRDIVFKFIDETFVQQKKRFSQNSSGRLLMRKMAMANGQSVHQARSDSTTTGKRAKSFSLSSKETIDTFFESLLERKSPVSSPLVEETSCPFTALPEPNFSSKHKPSIDIRKGFDFRSPILFRDEDNISVPRVIDVSFFNPQLCFFTPSRSPAGAVLLTAREAKVEFSPMFDKQLLISLQESLVSDSSGMSALDAKMGTRTRIFLDQASVFSDSCSNYTSWPRQFLQSCYAQELAGLQKLAVDTEITMVYDVSNIAYSWTPTSPRLKIFGSGDTIKFNSNGISLTTTSENFRNVLDVIVNLLVYRDPNQEIRSEKLETLLIAANLSDRRTFAAKMEEFRNRLDTLQLQLMERRDFELSFFEIENLLEQFDRTERDLALIGEAMRMIQASREELSQKRSRLTLNVLIDRIQWTLLISKPYEPSFDLQPACNISLQDITNQWISKEDGSMENTFVIGSANFINQLPVPFYRNVLKPFDLHHGQDGIHLKATVDYGCLLRFYAKSRLPVNGIPVLDHVEVDLSPLQLQLTFDIATQLYKFFLPEKIKKSSGSEGGEDVVEDKGFLARTLSSRPRSRTEISELILSEQLVPFDEVLEMKQRSEQNVFFVYVKVPPSQHLVSYKSSGRSSLLDIDRFVLSLPEMEYQNRLWSWPEFFNQLRKDMIVVLLKNAGSLFKDKIKKLGQRNRPERPDDPHFSSQDELYLRNLARKEKIDLPDEETPDERNKKNFLVFGKSIFKLMKK